ncbi:hypothetical protein [Azospirillum halopraeferens]|uniref:hypothetical protein n=1 Tax=Azospirillum halopraeferens TaxID=34010 RepID=UPI00042931E7|nr:hypothetical protein [Azospirillum halopraeferens]
MLAAALVLVPAVPAHATDLHRLFEDRCESCHGHAGDFAREALHDADGALAGRRPRRDLITFLERHQGGLPRDLALAVHAMLLAQVRTDPLFRDRCSQCHGRAADLVRDTLIRRDGVVIGRYTGRPVAEFLAGHGRLSSDEVPVIVELLTRLEREVHWP